MHAFCPYILLIRWQYRDTGPAGDTWDRIGHVTWKVLLEPEDKTPPADDVGHAFDEATALEAAKRKAAERGHHALKVVREDGFPQDSAAAAARWLLERMVIATDSRQPG